MATNDTEKLPFKEIIPWNEPVDGTDLLNSIEAIFTRYLSLPDGAATTQAVWVLHTYCIDLFEFTPRLCLVSPEKRCGKTTNLRLIENLSYRPVNVASTSTASLFRGIDKWHPTMCIDEADTFINGYDELRGIINAGYEQDGKVSRTECVGKKYDVKLFRCFSPVAIAAIGSIPGTIADRGITICMQRKKSDEHKDKLRISKIKPNLYEIQRKCLRFAKDNKGAIINADPDIPNVFNDRAADIWETLFKIVSVVSPEWTERLRIASLLLYKSKIASDPQSIRVTLLSDIRDIFKEKNNPKYIATENLLNELKGIKISPWEHYNNRGLNDHSLAGLLSSFNIISHQMRAPDGRKYRYVLKDFQDAFERYLAPIQDNEKDCASVPDDTDILDIPD